MEWLRLLLGTIHALLRGRRDLVLENLLLRQQLAVVLRTGPHPRLRRRDKAFWLVAWRLCHDWRRYLVLVQPATVIRWHRQGWRLFWWWKSRRPCGRPRLSTEVRELITRISRENVLWGTERIRGELLKLGIAVSACSIRRYRWRRPPRPPSQTWRTFLGIVKLTEMKLKRRTMRHRFSAEDTPRTADSSPQRRSDPLI
jgi:putative transposase